MTTNWRLEPGILCYQIIPAGSLDLQLLAILRHRSEYSDFTLDSYSALDGSNN